MARHTVYVSVGSNLGDKVANCRRGLAALEAVERTRITAASPFYRTAPVDYLDQDWFVNAAVRVETELAPGPLLDALQAIQRQAGRAAQKIRFGPRVLDLDILLFDDRVIDRPRLAIPHPRMHKRRFVLQPLCDIDPGIVHPLRGRTVRRLLADLDADDQALESIDD